MGRDPKPSGCLTMISFDALRSIFGIRRRKSRVLACESRTFDRMNPYQVMTPIENSKTSDTYDIDLKDFSTSQPWSLQRLTSSGSNDESKRSTSSNNESKRSSDDWKGVYTRRRKGFYCMRLRIVHLVSLVAIIRKVKVAYRRMMHAAAASQTILSFADFYSNIADLIPPIRKAHHRDSFSTIVVIRPVKCASDEEPKLSRTGVHARLVEYDGDSSKKWTSRTENSWRQVNAPNITSNTKTESSWPKCQLPSFKIFSLNSWTRKARCSSQPIRNASSVNN